VITGATQGLGLAYAREFLRRGHRVVISGRDAQRVSAALTALRTDGASVSAAHGVTADVSEHADAQRLWDAAARALGRIDLWINNAGYARTGLPIARLTPTEMQQMVRTNLLGTMNASQVAVAGFRRQGGGGKLFNTLGGGAEGRIVPGMAGYSATKRGVWYFTKTLRKETAGTGLVVGLLSPGMNVTEGLHRELAQLAPAERAKAAKLINLLADRVETTAPWLVERMLAASAATPDVKWMTSGRMLRRMLGAAFSQRRVLDDAAGSPKGGSRKVKRRRSYTFRQPPPPANRLRSVVVPTRPMHVAVLQLFLGRVAHFGDLDREMQVLAREGVVAIDGDHVADDLRDRDHARLAVRGLRMELHARLRIRAAE
jgi:short-subunit dehydrogenase